MAHASRKVRQTRRLKRTRTLASKQARRMFLELFQTRALLGAVLLAKPHITISEHDMKEASEALAGGIGRISSVALPGNLTRLSFVINKATTQALDSSVMLPTDPDSTATLPSVTDSVDDAA